MIMIWLEDRRLVSSPPCLTGFPRLSSDGAEMGDVSDLVGRNILLVEDEMILAMEIEHSLDEAGAHVIGPAGRLRDALQLALDRKRQMDAAILDGDLHGLDVFPVADALKARGVPFLFHTAHGSRAGLKDRYSGAVVCTKPVFSEHLVALVAGLID